MNTKENIAFKVIDAPTGAGKTTALIKMINAAQPAADNFNRFLVLTPLLSEVERICNATTCVQPLENKRKHTSKLHALKQLIISGENICCTHALYTLFDSEVKALLSNGDYEYTLIIDEEPTVILDCIDQNTPKNVANRELQELNKLNPQDYAMLRAQGYLLMNETTGQLYWNDDKEYTGRCRRGLFEGFRKSFDNLDLYSINNDKQVIAVVKPSIWYCFDNVYISTYRLHESYFDYYCRLYGFNIEYYHISSGGDIAAGFVEAYPKGLDRIVICDDDKYNLIDDDYKLSKNWFRLNCSNKNSTAARKLHNALRGFLRYGVPKGQTTGYFWTTFKGFKNCLTGRGVSPKRWIAHTTRATNEFINCNAVAFVCDKFPNPNIVTFFSKRGITVNKKEYALSAFIQFLWRSSIRNTACANKVYVYIPAHRLRMQFKSWLHTAKEHKKG